MSKRAFEWHTHGQSYSADGIDDSTESGPRSAPIVVSPDEMEVILSPSASFPPASMYHTDDETEHAPSKKLTKRRPSSSHSSRHHHSSSVPVDLLSHVSWSPVSPPGIDASVHGHERGRSAERERSRERDKENADRPVKSGSRSRSVLGIRLGGSKPVEAKKRRKSVSTDTEVDGVYGNARENVQADFLPPLRPPSPLWAGSFGKVCVRVKMAWVAPAHIFA